MSGVGLYSIGVRGLDVPDLLEWARKSSVPFLHLRGGHRGFDLVNRDATTLRAWRRRVRETVPITGVTADLDLTDLLTTDHAHRRQAAEELRRLSEAAAELGAGWIRLLARTPLARATPLALPQTAVPLLVEPHHPDWLTSTHLATLYELTSGQVRLLADTAQLGATVQRAGESGQPALTWLLSRTEALHLSDDGTGLAAHPDASEVAARAACRIAAGQRIEVAVEWTGPDRSPATCLAKYRAAASWWNRLDRSP
ncbi:AP endonuclease [Streptomyces durbertensis]|uniref:AP endonuclease n=1 Tax=Streptomyces durbertensis TaxID=2448886 RepID=A0ABR6EHW7_9ACTN|nr:AP endonuclease [Streptomyces durbertensis]MBB1244929.1 AP endonuclease [Streptomyces durbertensis]